MVQAAPLTPFDKNRPTHLPALNNNPAELPHPPVRDSTQQTINAKGRCTRVMEVMCTPSEFADLKAQISQELSRLSFRTFRVAVDVLEGGSPGREESDASLSLLVPRCVDAVVKCCLALAGGDAGKLGLCLALIRAEEAEESVGRCRQRELATVISRVWRESHAVLSALARRDGRLSAPPAPAAAAASPVILARYRVPGVEG
jgi:hypothetical protein